MIELSKNYNVYFNRSLKMQTISIKRSKKKQVITLILDFIAILFMGQRVYDSVPEVEQLEMLLGGVAIFSFIVYGIVGMVRLVNTKDSITISDQGIVDGGQMTGVGLIEWDNIKEIKMITYMSKTYIGIELYNNRELLSRLSGIKQWTVRNNIQEYKVAVTIGKDDREYTLSEIEVMMNKALEESRVQKKIV